jgi:hypothetical protein
VKIVVTSGCVKARQDDLPREPLFIEKPYDPTHVAEKLKELVDAQSLRVALLAALRAVAEYLEKVPSIWAAP